MNHGISNTFDTIAGISTAAGGGIGVVRVSGRLALDIAEKLFVPQNKSKDFKSFAMKYGIVTNISGAVIDEALLAVMLAPKTYTREDIVEFQCHGGEENLKRILEAVIGAGARPADPGEFTKRAFLNGRIDLSQAEAVMDVIKASSSRSAQAAYDQLSGRLSQEINSAYTSILDIVAGIEAGLDDPENEYTNGIDKELVNIKSKLEKLYKSFEYGKVIKEGINTAIAGKPNVGKSSLLNCLLGQERAIVTDIPGTTRDVLTERLKLGKNGLVLNISDTAGIRKAENRIEAIGVELARKYMGAADLVLLVLDGSEDIDGFDLELINEVENLGKKTIYVLNKNDMPVKAKLPGGLQAIEISAAANSGIEDLIVAIEGLFLNGSLGNDDGVIITCARHASLLHKSLESLDNAIKTAVNGLPEDFITIDLMEACGHLAGIIGKDVNEDMVNNIFSNFCMGK